MTRLIAAVLVGIFIAAKAWAADADHVDFKIVVDSGHRPVITALVNGKPFQLVVHSNAGLFLQINHADATRVGAHDLKHQGAFGIVAAGKVSDLGRDDGIVDRLQVGSTQSQTIPVAVFETPGDITQGMLGLGWLTQNHAVVDYADNRIELPSAPSYSQTLHDRLIKGGYTALPMVRNAADGRYRVTVKINGVAAPMVVSTVAQLILDTQYAARAGVKQGKEDGLDGGPTGTTGTDYLAAEPVTFRIGPWSSLPLTPMIQDTYNYRAKPRPAAPEDAEGGYLGADFMMETKAVIDFGGSTLYLRNF
jgi:predicted aspartyl protease